jgi:hypothetical protein
MPHRRIPVLVVTVMLLTVATGCAGPTTSDTASRTDNPQDVVLGSVGPVGTSSIGSTAPATSSAPASSNAPTDTAPRVPPGAVMAATVIVDSGPFEGTSQIQSTATVGCSYSLLGDKQWRINFYSNGEFAAKDTTSSGRPVVSFGVTIQQDGSGDLGVVYTAGKNGNDLEDSHATTSVVDDGASVTFTYTGRNSDGAVFHGAALCTKALRGE